MMEREHKVPGGKLIRIRGSITDGRITSIEIHGDFFLHPEQTITAIEKDLIGCDPEQVAERVRRTLHAHDAQLIGCTPEDIESVIRGTP